MEGALPDFSGIYTRSESSHFIFLDANREVSGDLISSLQAFETSLILISLGRWTNALISITNAIEILLREFTRGEREFYLLIDDFAASFDISDDLKKATHRVRKKRNEFTHSAVIPDDNDDAIRAYMEDALSVYKIFLQKSVNIDLYKSIWIPRLRENLVFAKNEIKKLPANAENVGFHLAVLVKTIANNIHEKLTPEAMYYLPDESTSWEAWEEIKNNQRQFEDMHQSTFVHDAVPCPAECDGFLSVELDEAKAEEEFQKNPFGFARCPKCGLMILPEAHIKKYVLGLLSAEQIQDMIK